MDRAQVAGAILLGGASSRFGSDKALAKAGDGLLGQRVVAALRGGGLDPVVAVGGTAGSALGLVTLADTEPLGGPLPAVAQTLSYFGRGHVLVCPCDLPLLAAQHVAILIDALHRLDGDGPPTAVVAEVDGRPQPSLGIWPTSWALAARRAVVDGRRAFRDALQLGPWIPVEVPPEALADADTPETLEELLRITDVGPAGVPAVDLD